MKLSPDDDITRLRAEYARRAADSCVQALNDPSNAGYRFALDMRARALRQLLADNGLTSLADKRVLEIGCGDGGVLREWLALGVAPGNLHGVDLLPDRLPRARGVSPAVSILCADARSLPYPSASFDLVLQFTALTSLLSPHNRAAVAAGMLRVLRPGGSVVWYDFWLNPRNPHARGITRREMRRLFPGCRIDAHRVTLAPPVARRLAGRWRGGAVVLENLRLFNTHFLAIITPAG